MGTADKAIRIVIAFIFGALYFTNTITGPLAITLLIISIIFVLTSIISFCPLYSIIGIKTCPINNEKGKN